MRRFLSILLSVDGDKPLPKEFRLFKAGINATYKGDFVLDDASIASIMADYEQHGCELMIDLEHLSVAPEAVTGDARNYDPDARGWFTLEVRDGELWATNVRWTPDGEQRLRSKKQRYISPAFDTDDDNRVTSIFNVALTATPATHEAQPLVAASARKDNAMTLKEALRLLNKIAGIMRSGENGEKAITTLAIDMKTLQAVVKAMGGDPSGDLGALIATVSGFAQELVDAASGKAKPEEKPADAPVESADAATVDEAMKTMARQSHELKTLAAKHEALKTQIAAEKAERELEERRNLVAALVHANRETPATAWVNSDGKTPKGSLLSMPLEELRERVAAFGASPQMADHQPPTGQARITSASTGAEISEYEVKRVEIASKRLGKDKDTAVLAYREAKNQQLRASRVREDRNLTNRFGRAVEQENVIANVHGVIGHEELALLSTPVKPIETFGATSQRALEEFRIDYMVNLAATPPDWTQDYGELLASGALKETFPLDFSAVAYEKRQAQNAKAETPQSKEISVTKEEYRVAKQCDLRRLMNGDFAYIRSWQQGAAQMARARVLLRAKLVKTLLEAGASTAWVDGANFFSASHKVHPFDPTKKMLGSATWSNYQASATPLSGPNLTAEKVNMDFVPAFDGELLGTGATDALVPQILKETARLLLTVQDIVLDAAATLKSVNNVMGAVRNEHYNSGFGYTVAPQLTGSASTADWYLISRDTIAQGYTPWVIAEDGAEEILEWDQSSEHYKNTGFIKTESKLYVSAALLWPHGIRLEKGT